MKTIALFSKPDSAPAWGALQQVVFAAKKHGFHTLHDLHAWTGPGWSESFCQQVRDQADLAVSIGGDGTLLGVARSLFGWGKPVLGVNLGTLGFLTDVPADGLEAALETLAAQDYSVEERILVEARISPASADTVEPGLAFNDVVISKGDHGQLMTFDVFVDEVPLYRLRADGLIVTTPTGSTAYSLSANGPILHPKLKALALVPLCPHSLTARPITLSSDSRIEIVVRGPVTGRVHCDGQVLGPLMADGDRLVVAQAEHQVPMLHLKGYSFFEALREKLGWSSARSA